MTQRRLELSSALSEKDPLTLVYNGDEYRMPGSVPAAAVLRYLPSISEHGGIPPEMLGDFFSDLIGDENYQTLLSKGMTFDHLGDVVNWLLTEYGLITREDEAEGTAEVAPGPNPS